MAEASQITFSEDFIKSLLSKLKIGNRKGIHLNALPGRYASRLDLKDLDRIKPGLSDEFFEKLLSEEKFSFDINFDGIKISKLKEKEKNALFLLSRKLNNLVYENEDQFLEFGIKNFGLGYPLLVRRDINDPTKIIKAPLLIWNLDISKSSKKSSSWSISKNEDSPIILNELLRSHIASDAQISIERLPEDVLDDNLIDKKELIKLCKQILEQLNITDSKNFNLQLEPCPAKDQIEAIATDTAWIQWSAIFGIYKSRKESIIHSNEDLLKELKKFQDEHLILENFQTSTVSAVETDPSKEEIINSFTNTEFKLIQGPPGTGKSQALTAIITNALENGGRCLVVCEKKTALEVIYKNLEKIGLDKFCVLIDDVNRDRGNVVKKARLNAETSSNSHRYNSYKFEEKYKKFINLRDSFNKKHAELFKSVIGEKVWKDVIGEFIKSNKKKEYTLLQSKLNYSDFTFTNEEFVSLRDVVFEASNLFGEFDINKISALKEIDKNLFKQDYTRSLHDRLNTFADERVKFFDEFHSSLSGINEEDVTVGKDNITAESGLNNKLSSLSQGKNILDFAIDSIENYRKLCNTKRELFRVKPFDVVSALFSKKRNILNLKKKTCYKKISEYNEHIKTILDIELQPFTIKPDLQLEILLDTLLVNLSVVQRYIKKIEDILSLLKLIKEKESFLENDEYTKREKISLSSCVTLGEYVLVVKKEADYFLLFKKELHEYEPFHRWCSYTSKLTMAQHKILSALVKLDLKDGWENCFVSWYLYGALVQHESKTGSLNTNDNELKTLTGLYDELQNEQVKKIVAYWQDQAEDERESYNRKGNFNLLYNLRKNRTFDRTNSLRRIIYSEPKLFKSLFPVILTNPIAADSILPLQLGSFEVVIFDEASQLRIEDTFTSLIRGRYKVIAGDKHQMPPSNFFEAVGNDASEHDSDELEMSEEEVDRQLALSESLLDYAENLQKKSYSYLDYHYRSKHPALIDFSNAAFYGGNLVPFPASQAYNPIEFLQVDGVYGDNINLREVEEVVRILAEDIHVKQDGSYPSVGIATFNLRQRNQIFDSLNEKTANDKEFSEVIEGIKKSGFFIKNLENIQGDEMDIMIISTTYGKDGSGNFFERYGPVNYEKGYKLLNVLITRAKHKIFVCTSIPKTKYLTYKQLIEINGNNKKAMLYAYLMYAEAVSKNDTESIKTILSDLKERSHESVRLNTVADVGLTESPFEQEVYEVLLEQLPEDQIKTQHKIGGFRIDFVLVLENKIKIAIECDGKTYHSSNEAYAYDMFRQKELEKMGYIVYRIWSTKWWHHYNDETIRLGQFINKFKQRPNKPVLFG